MIKAEPELASKARRVISLQLLTSLVVAVLFMLHGVWASISAFYGGLASVSVALLLSRGVERASAAALQNPKESMKILYMGAVQRFVLVAVLLAFGLAVLELEPVAVCVGFGLAQFSYLMSSRNRREAR